MWWSENQEWYGGVGVLVKKNCMKKSSKLEEEMTVMSLAIDLEELLRVVCKYAPQSGKSIEEKDFFHGDLSREWTTYHMSELIIGMIMGDLNRHVGRNIDIFQGVHG